MLLLTAVAMSVSAASAAAPLIVVPNPPAEVLLVPKRGHMPVINPVSGDRLSCPPTALDQAARRGGKLMPRKLTELPPATTYMAVWRHVGGCVAPLTMVEYRNPRRR